MSDKTYQLKSALLSTLGVVSLENDITISDKIVVDLTDKSIELNGKFNYKITATNTASSGKIATPDGCLTINKAVNVKISNLTIQATSSGLYPGLDDTTNFNNGFLCGLLIQNCDNVILDNITVLNSIYAGIMIVDCTNVQIINCKCFNNLYAGCLIRRSKYGVVKGGSYSNNGVAMTYTDPVYLTVSPYNSGYGLDFTQGISAASGQNEDWEVSGVTANHNIRKGIGAHQIVRGKFIGNHVFGYGSAGMSADNQGYEFLCQDVIFSHNTIIQDPDFFADKSVENHAATPLTVGS